MAFNISRKQVLLALGFLIGVVAIFVGFTGSGSDSPFNGTTFRIGRDPAWYPLPLHGKEKNMVGFTNELMRLAAKSEKFGYQILESGPLSLVERLNRGDFDGIFSTMSPNSINRNRYAFSEPIYLAGPVVIVPQDSPINSLQDLQGKIVGVPSGEMGVYMIENLPLFLIIPYGTLSQALDAMTVGNNDAVIANILDATSFVRGVMRGTIKIVTPPLNDYGIRLVTKKGSAETAFLSHFDNSLKTLYETGVYDRLLDKWSLEDTVDDGY